MTPQHTIDVLDEPSGLGGSIGRSFLAHALIAGSLIGWAMWKGPQQHMGDLDAQGGAIGVGVVNSIPLPQSSGIRNPVADDSDSQSPREKEKEVKEEKQKDALEKLLQQDLKPMSNKKKSSTNEKQEVADNQVRSAESRVSSPLFGGVIGSGGIGARSSTFGDQFGAYVQALQQLISSKWHASELDARLKSVPVCMVAFEIQRNGSIDRPRVVQSSGNQEVDLSAIRAVTEASPFQPLPQGYKGSSAKMEVGFKLQR